MPDVVVFDTARIHGQLARVVEVQAAVIAKTVEIGVTADVLFASHDHPGGHSVQVDHGETDGFVSLVGPAALSVEYGHYTPSRRRFVRGLHILTRAAGI